MSTLIDDNLQHCSKANTPEMESTNPKKVVGDTGSTNVKEPACGSKSTVQTPIARPELKPSNCSTILSLFYSKVPQIFFRHVEYALRLDGELSRAEVLSLAGPHLPKDQSSVIDATEVSNVTLEDVARVQRSWEEVLRELLSEWNMLMKASLWVSSLSTLVLVLIVLFAPVNSNDEYVNPTVHLLSKLTPVLASHFCCICGLGYMVHSDFAKLTQKKFEGERMARWIREIYQGNPASSWNIWVYMTVPLLWILWTANAVGILVLLHFLPLDMSKHHFQLLEPVNLWMAMLEIPFMIVHMVCIALKVGSFWDLFQ